MSQIMQADLLLAKLKNLGKCLDDARALLTTSRFAGDYAASIRS
jgi:hypothetical protein